MTRLFSSLALVLLMSVATVGCRDSSDRNGSAQPGTPGNAGPTSSQPTGPAGPGQNPPNRIVGQLTGDPDDEVSPQLQDLVARAVRLGDTDEPLEGF